MRTPAEQIFASLFNIKEASELTDEEIDKIEPGEAVIDNFDNIHDELNKLERLDAKEFFVDLQTGMVGFKK